MSNSEDILSDDEPPPFWGFLEKLIEEELRKEAEKESEARRRCIKTESPLNFDIYLYKKDVDYLTEYKPSNPKQISFLRPTEVNSEIQPYAIAA